MLNPSYLILILPNQLCSHLLLQVTGHLNWKTPKNRSHEYVNKILAELKDKALTNMPVKSVERKRVDDDKYKFVVTTLGGVVEEFDKVIFACHPDQALRILGESATEAETAGLSQFHYAVNDTYIHCDENLMPKSRAAWTSWNYIGQSNTSSGKQNNPVFVTYWLNKLQHLNHPTNIFVSLNPTNPPNPGKVFKRLEYSHPQYTRDSVKAQRAIAQLQGLHGAYFCG